MSDVVKNDDGQPVAFKLHPPGVLVDWTETAPSAPGRYWLHTETFGLLVANLVLVDLRDGEPARLYVETDDILAGGLGDEDADRLWRAHGALWWPVPLVEPPHPAAAECRYCPRQTVPQVQP